MTNAKLKAYRSDPAAFVLDIMAEMGLTVAPCQERLIRQMGPSLLAVADGRKPPISRLWLEATKGHGKSLLVAPFITWLLAFSPTAQTIHVGARDQAQADESTRKWVLAILRKFPWLAKMLTVTRDSIECKATGSVCQILTSESGAGAHGARITCLCLEEIVHQNDEDHAQACLDNLAKNPNGLLLAATNSGHTGTWQYRLREIARTSPDNWLFVQWTMTPAHQNPADIEEARKRRSLTSFNRLFRGIWSANNGDALDPELIENSITLSGPMMDPAPNWVYVGSLDLSVNRDHSALVVLGVEIGVNRVSLVACKRWVPSKGRQIDLNAIERYVLDFHSKFRLRTLLFDPYAAAQMAQTFVRQGLCAEPMNFVGRNLNLMATTILETFSTAGAVALYREPDLIRDLQRLSIVEMPYGYKLDSVRDADGHADAGIAFAIGLPEAVRIAGQQSPNRTPPKFLNIKSAPLLMETSGIKGPNRGPRRIESRPTYNKWGTFPYR